MITLSHHPRLPLPIQPDPACMATWTHRGQLVGTLLPSLTLTVISMDLADGAMKWHVYPWSVCLPIYDR